VVKVYQALGLNRHSNSVTFKRNSLLKHTNVGIGIWLCIPCPYDVSTSASWLNVSVAVVVVVLVIVGVVELWALVSVVPCFTAPETSIVSLFVVRGMGSACLGSVSKSVAVITEEAISLVVLSALPTLGPLAKIRFRFSVGDYGIGAGVSLTVPFPFVVSGITSFDLEGFTFPSSSFQSSNQDRVVSQALSQVNCAPKSSWFGGHHHASDLWGQALKVSLDAFLLGSHHMGYQACKFLEPCRVTGNVSAGHLNVPEFSLEFLDLVGRTKLLHHHLFQSLPGHGVSSWASNNLDLSVPPG
jgi:hypothetical protein